MFQGFSFQKPRRLEAWMVWGKIWGGGAYLAPVSGRRKFGPFIWLEPQPARPTVGRQTQLLKPISYAQLLDDSAYPNLNGDEQSGTRSNQKVQQDKDIQENRTSWYLHHKLAPNAWVGRNVRSVEIVFE